MAVLETVGAILGIGGALGGAAGILYGAVQKNAIQTYKDDNDALRGLVQTKDAIIEGKAATIVEIQNQNEVLKGGIQILRETVTAAPEITRLSTDMARQNAKVLKELSNVAHSNSQVSNSLTQLIQLIGDGRTLVISPKDKVQKL